jgi:hypothetical protein
VTDIARIIDINPDSLPGNPSIQLAQQILTETIHSHRLHDKIHVQADSDRVRCTPNRLSENKRTTATEELKSGAMAYLSLQKFYQDFPELFVSYEDAQSYARELPFIDIIDTFAVSRARLSMLEKLCAQTLQDSGYVDLQVSQNDNFNALF